MAWMDQYSARAGYQRNGGPIRLRADVRRRLRYGEAPCRLRANFHRRGHRKRKADVSFAPLRLLMRRLPRVAVRCCADRGGQVERTTCDARFRAPRRGTTLPRLRRVARSPGAYPRASRRYAPIASAIIPGSGQVMLGNDRFIGYFARRSVEPGGSTRRTSASARIAGSRSSRNCARRRARSHFSEGSTGFAPRRGLGVLRVNARREGERSFSLSTTRAGRARNRLDDLQRQAMEDGAEHVSTREAALQKYWRIAIRPGVRWSWTSAQFQ